MTLTSLVTLIFDLWTPDKRSVQSRASKWVITQKSRKKKVRKFFISFDNDNLDTYADHIAFCFFLLLNYLQNESILKMANFSNEQSYNTVSSQVFVLCLRYIFKTCLFSKYVIKSSLMTCKFLKKKTISRIANDVGQ